MAIREHEKVNKKKLQEMSPQKQSVLERYGLAKDLDEKKLIKIRSINELYNQRHKAKNR